MITSTLAQLKNGLYCRKEEFTLVEDISGKSGQGGKKVVMPCATEETKDAFNWAPRNIEPSSKNHTCSPSVVHSGLQWHHTDTTDEY